MKTPTYTHFTTPNDAFKNGYIAGWNNDEYVPRQECNYRDEWYKGQEAGRWHRETNQPFNPQPLAEPESTQDMDY